MLPSSAMTPGLTGIGRNALINTMAHPLTGEPNGKERRPRSPYAPPSADGEGARPRLRGASLLPGHSPILLATEPTGGEPTRYRALERHRQPSDKTYCAKQSRNVVAQSHVTRLATWDGRNHPTHETFTYWRSDAPRPAPIIQAPPSLPGLFL